MQPVPAQRQLENGRDMPPDESQRRGEPAKRGICNEMSEPFYRTSAENGAHDAASEGLREAVQQWQLRRAQQNQGRRNGHQQQMLQHVNRKQRIVKRIQRGTNGGPPKQISTKKAGNPPG